MRAAVVAAHLGADGPTLESLRAGFQGAFLTAAGLATMAAALTVARVVSRRRRDAPVLVSSR